MREKVEKFGKVMSLSDLGQENKTNRVEETNIISSEENKKVETTEAVDFSGVMDTDNTVELKDTLKVMENKETSKQQNIKKDSSKKTTRKKKKVEEVVIDASAKDLINLESSIIKENLDLLLLDRTTGKNIIWATDLNKEKGKDFELTASINKKILSNEIIQPRVAKSLDSQKERTKGKAEVFTPSWICNKMNNLLDEEWFGYKDVFNVEDEENKSWKTNSNKVEFKNGKTLDDYLKSMRLEITCGEAPFLVSRYDSATGQIIDVKNRVGLLDRKLRLISENVDDKVDWIDKVHIAYKSIYGYEYQGDNLLIARINILITFIDYYKFKFGVEPSLEEVKDIAEIISWNVWQMDGLSYKLPMADKDSEAYCKIMDWNENKKIEFRNIVK